MPLNGSLKAVTKKVVHENCPNSMSAVFERNETGGDGVRQQRKRTNALVVHLRFREAERTEMNKREHKFDASKFGDSRTSNVVFDGVFSN